MHARWEQLLRFLLQTRKGHFALGGVGCCFWIIFVRFALPWVSLPYEWGDVWFWEGSLGEMFRTLWPLFALGFGLNLVMMSLTTNPPGIDASELPVKGFFVSLQAGILEEIVFRWIWLYAMMALVWVIDAVFGGAISRMLTTYEIYNRWIAFLLQDNVDVWTKPGAWTVGMAVLLSNWKFQEGHLYQGPMGFVFSGIGGIVFFRAMFSFGLPLAMLAHVLFDIMVFLMVTADVIIEQEYLGVPGPAKKFYRWY